MIGCTGAAEAVGTVLLQKTVFPAGKETGYYDWQNLNDPQGIVTLAAGAHCLQVCANF